MDFRTKEGGLGDNISMNAGRYYPAYGKGLNRVRHTVLCRLSDSCIINIEQMGICCEEGL